MKLFELLCASLNLSLIGRMGDQAPPNFNPSVSLLSGGESVPITAVQGGGSLADVSMLSGGEAAIIVPVRGGAGILKKAGQAIKKRLGFKSNNNLENVREVNMSNEAKNARKGPPKKTEAQARANIIKERENEEVEANRGKEEENENKNGDDGDDDGYGDDNDGDNDGDGEDGDGEDGDGDGNNDNGEDEESLLGSTDEEPKDIKISIDGLFFEIRSYNPATSRDWENGEYSEGEKKFKDSLELTDELLKQTFGEGWKGEFAKFLKNIGYSSCFKDAILLTKAECEDTRIFTQKVHLKLYENLLKKFDKENDTSNSKSTEFLENVEENQDGGSRRRHMRLPSIGGFKSLHL